MENLKDTQRIQQENIITQSYESILLSSPDDALWSIRYWELYNLIYKYLETYIYPVESEYYSDFMEALSYDCKTENDSDCHSTFLNFLIKEKIPEDRFVSVFVSVISTAINQAKRRNYWFLKSGGSKISEKTLRKIAAGCSKNQFSITSENYEYGNETLSLFESDETADNNPFNEVPSRMLEVEETKELDDLLTDIDKKYVEAVSYKTKSKSETQNENKIKKPYLSAVITRVILLLFMCKRTVPIDTMSFLLLNRRFLYRPMYDDYLKTSEVYQQKEIAEIFNTTEKIISNEQKNFFRSFSKEKISLFLSLAGGNR